MENCTTFHYLCTPFSNFKYTVMTKIELVREIAAKTGLENKDVMVIVKA